MFPIRKASAGHDIPAWQVISASLPRRLAQDADAPRKQARKLSKQQHASERVAAPSSQLVSGINEGASAGVELKRAATQIATSAEQATGAAHESLAAINHISGVITRQMSTMTAALRTAESMQAPASESNSQMASTQNSEQMPRMLQTVRLYLRCTPASAFARRWTGLESRT